MSQPDEHERPRGRNLLLSALRSLLHQIIKAIVLVFLALRNVFRPKAVRYGVPALLVVVAVGWYALNTMAQGPGSASAPGGGTVSVPASSLLPPSPTVEQYLKAQAAFDAKGMWAVISDELKAGVQDSTATTQQLQAELDTARQQGRRYRSATYVGGVPMREGQNVYFYVLTVDGPEGTVDIPYIYVLGRDGKIVSIQ